jgi:hypothetical protein
MRRPLGMRRYNKHVSRLQRDSWRSSVPSGRHVSTLKRPDRGSAVVRRFGRFISATSPMPRTPGGRAGDSGLEAACTRRGTPAASLVERCTRRGRGAASLADDFPRDGKAKTSLSEFFPRRGKGPARLVFVFPRRGKGPTRLAFVFPRRGKSPASLAEPAHAMGSRSQGLRPVRAPVRDDPGRLGTRRAKHPTPAS